MSYLLSWLSTYHHNLKLVVCGAFFLLLFYLQSYLFSSRVICTYFVFCRYSFYISNRLPWTKGPWFYWLLKQSCVVTLESYNHTFHVNIKLKFFLNPPWFMSFNFFYVQFVKGTLMSTYTVHVYCFKQQQLWISLVWDSGGLFSHLNTRQLRSIRFYSFIIVK